MKPILYDSNETEFTTNGLGRLSEATKCTVTEERNGSYELEMEIPVTAKHFNDIKNTRLILAKPNAVDEDQPFEIYDISKSMSGTATVSARHISYRLSDIPCKPFSASSAAQALSGFTANAMDICPFDFWTDKETTANYTQELPASIRERMGGVEGSILDCFGGEYEFDRFHVRLWNHRGQNRGVTIRYGKNLTDAKQEQSIANTCTGIVGVWQGQTESGDDVTLYTDIVNADTAASFPYRKTKVVDFSSDIKDQPTMASLASRVQSYIKSNDIGHPDVSLDVSFVDLADTEEYKNLVRDLIGLCDTVTIEYEDIGISNTAEITKTEYDVLNERYNSITLGTYYSLESTISGIDSNINQTRKDLTSDLQKAKDSATKQITGTNGGYVKTQIDADGHPYELLIMDTDKIETAKKIWRWNQNGLGYSKTGYNGPYGLAMTQDGSIVADYITTGSMSAARVKTGLLTDQKGLNYWNLDSGEFSLQGTGGIGKGITLKDGKLTINGSYITSGTLKDGTELNYWNLETGDMSVTNSDGKGITLKDGVLTVNADVIANGTLDASKITVKNLVVGENVSMGSNAKISWANVSGGQTAVNNAIDNAGFATSSEVTTITKNAISTATISADNISGGTFNSSGNISMSGYLKLTGVTNTAELGAIEGSYDTGVGLKYNGSSYFIATQKGVRMQYGTHRIWVDGDGCYFDSGNGTRKVGRDYGALKCYHLWTNNSSKHVRYWPENPGGSGGAWTMQDPCFYAFASDGF